MINLKEPTWEACRVPDRPFADGRDRVSVAVQHDDLLQCVCAQLERRGVVWHDLRKYTFAQGRDAVMSLAVKKADSAYELSLGIENRNDGRHRVRFYAGAVWPGGESVVAHEFRASADRRFTGMDMTQVARDAVGEFLSARPAVRDAIKGLDKAPLPPADYESLMLEFGRGNLLPWSRLNRVDQLWQGSERWTALTLLKCFSMAVGLGPPEWQMRNAHKAFRLVSEKVQKGD